MSRTTDFSSRKFPKKDSHKDTLSRRIDPREAFEEFLFIFSEFSQFREKIYEWMKDPKGKEIITNFLFTMLKSAEGKEVLLEFLQKTLKDPNGKDLLKKSFTSILKEDAELKSIIKKLHLDELKAEGFLKFSFVSICIFLTGNILPKFDFKECWKFMWQLIQKFQ